MRRRDTQRSLRTARVIARELFKVIDVLHDAFGRIEDHLAGRRQALHALAMTREDRHAQLGFEIDNRFRYTGLRRMQCARRLGQAELVARRLAQETKLLQVHDGPSYG